jgi:hypothetical protein
MQRISLPLYSPAALTRDMDARQLNVTPLYAGECGPKSWRNLRWASAAED